jgi:YVTN family beta-propeller protein
MRFSTAFLLACLPASLAAQMLLVANQRVATVALINPATNQVTATIAENTSSSWGHELATTPDGKTAYLPIYGSAGLGNPGIDGREILALDIPTRSVKAHIDLGHGVRPHCIRFDPTSGLFFLTTELDQTVSILDPHTNTIVGSIPTGSPDSHMLALSHDGHFGYTANFSTGSVSILDLKARKLLAVLPLAPTLQRISISNDDRYVFTSNYTTPELIVLDTKTRAVVKRIPLPTLGSGSTLTPDGKSLLIALAKTNQVGVIDLTTLTLSRTIPVADNPQALLIRPDGKFAYVCCPKAGSVSVIDTATWKTTATIPSGPSSDGLAWAQ